MLLIPAASAEQQSKPQEKQIVTVVKAKQACPSLRKAIVYYRGKVWDYQDKLGYRRSPTYYPERKKYACQYKKFVMYSWRGQASEYRKAWEEYLYQWDWESWLPDKWKRIGHCETPTNGYYINWQHNSGTYQGGFGFYWGTWDGYKPAGAPAEAYQATPRQQYEAALNVYAAHGYGAWGCGGA